MSPATLGTAAALVLVPGIGAMLAVYPPGRAGLATRIALAFGLGYAAVGLTATGLVIAHVLSRSSFLVALLAVTLALWAAGLRRGHPGDHLQSLREELAEDRFAIAAGLVVLLAIAVVRLRSSPLLDFEMFGPWRYWADGLELADAGRVPAQSLQWGALYTPAISKLVLNSFHGGSSYLLGASPLPAMGALLWVASTGLAAGLWALGRELGLRLLSPLLPLLTLTLLNDELRRNLDVYTAENVGRMVAVCGLVVGVRALRDREGWLEPVVAAVLFGAGFATHGVPVVALMIALGWYGVARLVLEWDRGAIVARMAVIAVGAPALTVALLLSAGGTIGFQGASGADRYGSFGPGVDPTASLLAGTVEHSPTGTGHWFIPPHGILTYFLRTVTTLDDPPRILLWVIPIAAHRRRRRHGAPAPGRSRLDGHHGRWAGPEPGRARVPLLLPLHDADPGPVRHRPRVRLPAARRGHPRAGGARAGGRVAHAAARRGRRPRSRLSSSRSRPSRSARPSARPARATTPTASGPSRSWTGSRLTSPVTRASSPTASRSGRSSAATGRVSVVEGMGPYLRPEMLHPVLADVLRAHRFFERPAGGRRFLRREGVDYVIVVKGVRIGSMVGTLDSGVDPAGLAGVDFLRPVYTSPEADVYRVRGSGRLSGFPDPADYSGFMCTHGPVADGS